MNEPDSLAKIGELTDVMAGGEVARKLLEAVPDAIVISDGVGRIVFANAQTEQMFGFSKHELDGGSLEMLLPPRFRARHVAHVDAFLHAPHVRKMGVGFELYGQRKTGFEFPVEVSISPVRFENTMVVIAAIRDVSDRRRIEGERERAVAELALAQRMAAIGTLAAGVAHELNTPIQFVSDSVHFLRDTAADVFDAFDALIAVHHAIASGASPETIRAASDTAAEVLERAALEDLRPRIPQAFDRCIEGLARVAAIARSVKELAHPTQKRIAPADLNRAIVATLTVASGEYKHLAEVITEFSEIPPVVCHLGDINRAVLNLVVNAADAISDVVGATGRKGRITVRTYREANMVVVAISDTGAGIPEQIRTRVFEPFFTTKEVGRGTGQGLAQCWTIIKDNHGGELTFDTRLGEGTTFFIRLPIDGARPAP